MRGVRQGDFLTFQPKRRHQVKADSMMAKQLQEAELVNRRLTRATRAMMPTKVPVRENCENPEVDDEDPQATITEESKDDEPAN